MKQLEEAQQNFKKAIISQQRQLIQASQNVAQNYLKEREAARSQSSVSKSLISDLQHQINVLENIKKSGISLQENLQHQLEQYVNQYKFISQQLMQNNSLALSNDNDGQTGHNLYVDKTIDSKIVGFEQSMDTEQLIEQKTQNPAMKPVHKKNTRRITNKKWIKITVMSLQYANIALFAVLLLITLYTLIK